MIMDCPDFFTPYEMHPAMHSIMDAFIGPTAAQSLRELEAISGFRLNEDALAPFIDFIQWINSRPRFIEEWRANEGDERSKYLRMMNGVESSRKSFEACAYHLKNIKEYEDKVHAILSTKDLSHLPQNTVIAGGGTEKIDFEYQAFVMAARRSLDHMTWGLSTYFKVTQDSFNSFTKQSVEKYHPPEVARPVGEVCRRFRDQFSYIVSESNGRSLRDHLAHKEAVQSGAINLSKTGYRFVGGGEKLGQDGVGNSPKLADILYQRMVDLRAFHIDILAAFQESVMQYEAQ